MRLKVSVSNNSHVISVEDNSTLQELLTKLQAESIISNTADIKIKCGFPPKVVDKSDDQAQLLDIGIRAGDKLIIEEPSKPSSGANTAATPKQEVVQYPHGSAEYIPLLDGNLVLRKIPDDNSCLFRSISYGVFHNLEEGSQLRTIVADYIRSHQDTYNEAILGKPVREYITWIQKPTSWGGAIELQILSEHLNIQINSLDVETGRIDSFGDGKNCIFILYSGIHYDSVVYTPLNDVDNQDLDISVFETGSDLFHNFSDGLKALRKKLNQKGYVTNTSNFKIKCQVCGTILKGEKEASQHASENGHYEFGEV